MPKNVPTAPNIPCAHRTPFPSLAARMPNLGAHATKPLTGTNIPENIDCTYSMYVGNSRVPVAFGEMKRNLINRSLHVQPRICWSMHTLSETLHC